MTGDNAASAGYDSNMTRQNTHLESEGAEFLVLGNLLTLGIPSYKTYNNMPGYDITATNPERNRSARIQVKSRWRTGAEGFIIKNFDCDFVVVVLLNRGSKDGSAKVLAPEFYVLPVEMVQKLHNPNSTWGKLALSKIPGFKDQQDQWPIISKFLNDNQI